MQETLLFDLVSHCHISHTYGKQEAGFIQGVGQMSASLITPKLQTGTNLLKLPPKGVVYIMRNQEELMRDSSLERYPSLVLFLCVSPTTQQIPVADMSN